MNQQKAKEIIIATNCITGKPVSFTLQNNVIENIPESPVNQKTSLFAGPGLIDLQVNGINGIDFNSPSVSMDDLMNAMRYLLSIGVTTFFPTIITNSTENILHIARIIHEACGSDPLLNACVGGIHLEGPFLSPVEGAKGAHDEKYLKLPDWELFDQFQRAAGGRIKLVTIAPELDGSVEFIEKSSKEGIAISIGHSLANTEQILQAVKAGARLSTHLGNGVPLQLPRHPNLLWDQLAADELYACIIADGIHVPDSFIKVVAKAKGDHAILVSDSTCFAGMPPGEYQSHIGGNVIVDSQKRVSLKSTPGLLAGAGKSLLENIEYVYSNKLINLGTAWQMASLNVAGMLEENDNNTTFLKDDWVLFETIGGKIQITTVIKNGNILVRKDV